MDFELWYLFGIIWILSFGFIIMGELISQLGIDWRLLAAQVVNFLILFWVLKRFAFAPLKKFLRARREEIEKGLENAEHNRLQKEKLNTLRAEILAKSEKEAQNVLSEARQKGEKEYERILQNAKEKTHKLLDETKREIEQEKVKIIGEAKSELGKLVMMATERVLREKMNEEKDREIVERALNEMR